MQHMPLDAIISQYDLSTLPLIDSAIDQCLHHYYATLDEDNFSISNQNTFLAFSSPPKILNTITGLLYLILTRRVEDFRQSK